MSDLAPFVAATLRDRVVEELQNELRAKNQKLQETQRLLHQRHPRRSVKLCGPNNGEPVIVESSLYLPTAQHFWGTKFTFFNRVRGRQLIEPITIRVKDIPLLELWIDGGRAVRFQNLTFYYTGYTYEDTDSDGWQYFATLSARDADEDLGLEFDICLDPDDHAKLLNRESCVDFVPPLERTRSQYLVEGQLTIDEDGMPTNNHEQEIPITHLLDVCGGKGAFVFFDNWRCTGRWFFQHLVVPYAPVQENDPCFSYPQSG